MAKSKSALDKDLMFSKIMPSIALSKEAKQEEELSAFPEEDGGLRSRIFTTMDGLRARSSVATVNIMEQMVLENMDAVIGKFNGCRCDHCRCDMAALALNRLPAHYIVVSPEEMQARMEEVPKKQVLDALVQAVIKVRSNPRH